MEPAFWQERWARGETGFHLPRPHPKLQRHWPVFCTDTQACVFVPLCGKTLDIDWLLARGHRVIGAELNAPAVAELFARLNRVPEIIRTSAFEIHRAGALTVFVGDVFALSAADLSDVHCIYDRAALIALPPEMRRAYAALMNRLLPQAPQLLITLEYPQTQMSGPPFSVLPDELQQLYADRTIRLLERHDILAHEPRFAARGVTALHETVWELGVVCPEKSRVVHD